MTTPANACDPGSPPPAAKRQRDRQPHRQEGDDPVSSVSSSRPSSATSSPVAGFGTNEWLVEEMYQQYLSDPSSVDQAWHDFFDDYRPGSPVGAASRTEP